MHFDSEKKKRNNRLLLGNNKGLSFVEIIIAVVLLVIVVGPIMNSIIAAARVNKQSRDTMSATDMAEDIMEGFSDKSFYAISSIFSGSDGEGGVSTLTGKYALSLINGNAYNTSSAITKISGNAFPNIQAISKTSITVFGGSPTSTKAVATGTSDGKFVSNYLLDNFAIRAINALPTDNTGKKALVMYVDDADSPQCMLFAYTNVEWEGRVFDVVGLLLPAANAESDYYYPYTLMVRVYEARKTSSTSSDHFGVMKSESLLTISGGIKNN